LNRVGWNICYKGRKFDRSKEFCEVSNGLFAADACNAFLDVEYDLMLSDMR